MRTKRKGFIEGLSLSGPELKEACAGAFKTEAAQIYEQLYPASVAHELWLLELGEPKEFAAVEVRAIARASLHAFLRLPPDRAKARRWARIGEELKMALRQID